MTCSRLLGARLLGALVLLGALLALAACDDPTDVGGELIEEEGVGPERVVLPLVVDTTGYAPVTGTAVPGELQEARFLAGQQEAAPPLGDVKATGYIDFVRVSTPEEDLAGLTLDSVEVEVVAGYAYGDTTQTPTFALHDLTEEWDANGASADTTFDEGFAEAQPVTTFSAPPGDTVAVTLPESWIREHTDQLQIADDSAFAEAFHGFQVRREDGSGVAGFTSSATEMHARYESESGEEAPVAQFSLVKQLTTIRSTDREPTEDRYLIQDGTGRVLSFDLSVGSTIPDSLRSVSINDAQLVFEADTTLAAVAPSFARPQLETLDLYDVTEGDEAPPFLQARLILDADSSRFVNNFPLRSLVQRIVLGTSDVERIQLRPTRKVVQTPFGNRFVPVPSLSSALVRREPGHAPRLVLVYTPTDEE